MTDQDTPQDELLSSEDLIARARGGMKSPAPTAPPTSDITDDDPEPDFLDTTDPETYPTADSATMQTTDTWQPPIATPPSQDPAPSPWEAPTGDPAESVDSQSPIGYAPPPTTRPTDRIETGTVTTPTKRNLRPLIIAGAVVAALGWGALNADTSVEDVAVGDCFNNPDAEEVTSIKTIPCEESHDYEVMQIFRYTQEDDAPYPGDEDLWQTAVDGCIPDFQQYTGLVWENETELFIDAFYPLPDSWDAGDREAWCLLVRIDPDSFDIVPQSGSLRSS